MIEQLKRVFKHRWTDDSSRTIPLAMVDRLIQRVGIEIGPERIGEIQLGIGELPHQEVADALLTAGTDEQIRFRRVRHRKMGFEIGFPERGCQLGLFGQQRMGCLQDVPAATVVRANCQRELPVQRGLGFGTFDQVNQLVVEARQIADDFQANSRSVHLGNFLLQHQPEQLHQDRHLLGRPAPVLGRECEQGQVFDTALAAGPHRFAHRFDTALMPRHPRQEAARGPAPIAIHDDGDVARNTGGFRNYLG